MNDKKFDYLELIKEKSISYLIRKALSERMFTHESFRNLDAVENFVNDFRCYVGVVLFEFDVIDIFTIDLRGGKVKFEVFCEKVPRKISDSEISFSFTVEFTFGWEPLFEVNIS